jgi:hypothetical protein
MVSPSCIRISIKRSLNKDSYPNRIKGKDEIEAIISDSFDTTAAYAIDDVVIYNNKLYKFKAAHAANDPWDATEVDEVTVVELIEAAEPDSLTPAQIDALLDLLD